MGSLATVPYWHYNVPVDQRTAECPPFLLHLNDKDRRIIGSPDAAYTLLTWERVCAIVAANRLDLFQRIPSDLRRYKAFTHALAKRHGSVADFILKERLRWPGPIKPRGRPFQCPDDVKIIYNDWPYGLDKRIVHLVVWTKFELCEDQATGDLTDTARAEIDAFVATTFRSGLQSSQVMWFKNWSALKSIHAVEHFHVMMFDPDPDFIRDITDSDVPQCEKPDL
ncbi:hypothetical protein HRG_008088 [Hirsutella rhossiliensis]|uniref:N-acetylglucosamine-induced protein 1 n=1 Tax=Hirsutella rhossiliensis TaxID=111463 RepID=A0A9P8SGX1_9HYPO|nr:uncharacterized protein HRG_08088 [Hirsutella rhossiliensis]KAH0960935.1 hypothetical protein HRG_08088 [Hirsutella rhossiliensis]